MRGPLEDAEHALVVEAEGDLLDMVGLLAERELATLGTALPGGKIDPARRRCTTLRTEEGAGRFRLKPPPSCGVRCGPTGPISIRGFRRPGTASTLAGMTWVMGRPG